MKNNNYYNLTAKITKQIIFSAETVWERGVNCVFKNLIFFIFY
jgi:hypothetical protein